MKNCILCHKVHDRRSPYCQPCYNYLKKHPEGVYELPPKAELHYADNGDVICHICGQAHRKLGAHIMNSHHMSQVEYREQFGLYHNTKLSNQEYQDTLRQYVLDNYDTVVTTNLIEKGKNTRISDDNILPGRKLQNTILTKIKTLS